LPRPEDNAFLFLHLRIAAVERIVASIAERQGVPKETVEQWIEAAADQKDAAALMNASLGVVRTLKGH